MTLPASEQCPHMMTKRDAAKVRRDMRRNEGRNAAELELYTTDDLRRLYQATSEGTIRLRDGIVTRHQLVAEIWWRVRWARRGYAAVLVSSVVAAVAAVAGALVALFGWLFPLPPGGS